MTKIAHPMFAALARAGGAAARLVEAVDLDEARIAGLDDALDALALVDGPDLGGLLAGAGDETRLGVALARLAADDPVAEARRGPLGETRQPSDVARPVAVAPMPGGSQRSQGDRAVVAGPETAQRKRFEKPEKLAAPDAHLAGSDQSMRGAKVKAMAGQGPKSPRSKAKALSQSQTEASGRLTYSQTATQAAARRIITGISPDARQRVVNRILLGQPGLAAETPAVAQAQFVTEQQISRSLERLTRVVTPETPMPRSAPTQAQQSAAPLAARASDPAPDATPAQPAPRNGLERLLVKAGKPLVMQQPPQGQHASLAPDGPKPALNLSKTPAPAVPQPPASVQDMAQALGDVLRQEARAAGIDLNGGRA